MAATKASASVPSDESAEAEAAPASRWRKRTQSCSTPAKLARTAGSQGTNSGRSGSPSRSTMLPVGAVTSALESATSSCMPASWAEKFQGSGMSVASMKPVVSAMKRGALSPALLTADRLLTNKDPAVKRAGEIMVGAVEKAASLMADPADPSVSPPGHP